MRCWTFVVMDKDQNIRSQYDEKNIVNCCPDKIWQPEEVDNEENIEKVNIDSVQYQYIYKKYPD